MAKKRTKIEGRKKVSKPSAARQVQQKLDADIPVTVAEAKEALPELVNVWGGKEFAAAEQGLFANSLLPELITILGKAHYTVASVRGRGENISASDKTKAKFLAGLILSSIPKVAQNDVLWVASFDGRKGKNSWTHAARLRGDSPQRITSIATNCKRPSEMLGKIESRMVKVAEAKEFAAADGTPTVKKTQLDILKATFDKVHTKLDKANDGYPEEFNNDRRKTMAVELKVLMTEIDALIAHTQKVGD